MQFFQAHYVILSDVMKDCPLLQEAFGAADHKEFTWGTNNRSMIDVDTLRDAVQDLEGVYNVSPDERTDASPLALEYTDIFLPRIEEIKTEMARLSIETPTSVYIDLEN